METLKNTNRWPNLFDWISENDFSPNLIFISGEYMELRREFIEKNFSFDWLKFFFKEIEKIIDNENLDENVKNKLKENLKKIDEKFRLEIEEKESKKIVNKIKKALGLQK